MDNVVSLFALFTRNNLDMRTFEAGYQLTWMSLYNAPRRTLKVERNMFLSFTSSWENTRVNISMPEQKSQVTIVKTSV